MYAHRTTSFYFISIVFAPLKSALTPSATCDFRTRCESSDRPLSNLVDPWCAQSTDFFTQPKGSSLTHIVGPPILIVGCRAYVKSSKWRLRRCPDAKAFNNKTGSGKNIIDELWSPVVGRFCLCDMFSCSSASIRCYWLRNGSSAITVSFCPVWYSLRYYSLQILTAAGEEAGSLFFFLPIRSTEGDAAGWYPMPVGTMLVPVMIARALWSVAYTCCNESYGRRKVVNTMSWRLRLYVWPFACTPDLVNDL